MGTLLTLEGETPSSNNLGEADEPTLNLPGTILHVVEILGSIVQGELAILQCSSFCAVKERVPRLFITVTMSKMTC